MAPLRTLLWLTGIAWMLSQPAAAQTQQGDTVRGPWFGSARSYLGLNLDRSNYRSDCNGTSLICNDADRTARVYAGAMIGNFWGVEVGYRNMNRIAQGVGETRAQGLNLSLVGKASLGQSLGVFGKLGSTWGSADASSATGSGFVPGAERGFGLTYGAGVSYAFTPRLSATFEWDSNDFRFAGTGRDPVRSTSLGLRFRY
jgi:OmpA-OmpF porin, OOP family